MKEWNKKLVTFLVGAYGLFWLTFIVLIALIMTNVVQVNFEGQSYFMDGVKIFISWTPTMAVLLLRKTLFPQKSVKDIFKGMFAQKLNRRLFFFVLLLESGIYFLASIVTALWEHVSIASQWGFSWQFCIYSFLICLFTGATGEESGWHGFLFPHFMEKYGCIRSSVYVGIIWGLWHIPLWIISGYSGIGLVFYIVQFMICTIAWSLVMDILYYWNRNLLIVTTFHFMVNFLLSFFRGNDLVFQVTISILCVAVAAGFVILYLKGWNPSYRHILPFVARLD